MSLPRTYFLAPTRDCPPKGPIALGSLITSPLTPELPLAPHPIPIDESETPISKTSVTNHTLTLETRARTSLGIWTSFLQAVGLGADLSTTRDRTDRDVYTFERLETRTFWPSDEYARASISAPVVQAYLARHGFRRNVYMVTAVKVAFGAKVASTALRERGAHAHFGVDSAALGVPLGLGLGAHGERASETSLSFDGADPFVFAFRLREVCYERQAGLKGLKEYRKGAVYGFPSSAGEDEGDAAEVDRGESSRGERGEENEVEDGDEGQFVVLGLKEEDVNDEDVGADGMQVLDDEDGEECVCVSWEELA